MATKKLAQRHFVLELNPGLGHLLILVRELARILRTPKITVRPCRMAPLDAKFDTSLMMTRGLLTHREPPTRSEPPKTKR
jgi:hypothetical protein